MASQAARAVALIVSIICLACVCLAPGSARAARDELVIGIAQFPSSLHPSINPESSKNYVLGFSARDITVFDKDWKLVCHLCAELPSLDNGLARIEERPDGSRGMVVTLRLKPGLRWGDGVPVTANDIAFSFKVGADPRSGYALADQWTRVEKIDIVDALTVIAHLKTLRVNYAVWGPILPEHIEAKAYAEGIEPGDYGRLSVYNRAPTTPGLYNGPYLVTQYVSGSQVVLEPNPYWPGQKPHFKRIVLRLIENTAALQANLLSGDIDMAPGEGIGLTIDQVLDLRHRYPDSFAYIFKPSLTYEHLDVSGTNPLLADRRLRQALLYAADRKTMTEKLFAGMQPVADSFVSPLSPLFAPDLPRYDYDPAKAKALLAEAGFAPGPDGICRNAKGERLSFPLQTTAGNRLRELQEEVLQSDWKSACIEATIRNEPARTFFGETLKKRLYAGLAMYAWVTPVIESPRQTLASTSIPSEANGWAGSNSVGFVDQRFDELISRAETELDPEAQKRVWAQMQVIYASELPVLPLFFRAEPHVIPLWLKGYAATGHTTYAPDWAEFWSVE
ncbi:peptide/nickel transport system substrate-binding protein [Rhizobiales bacterium GAS113]|jgi:peptide/nickel transport system substrate-binding protein|nr:peptide/nickel transport system substrate-binding protein [Rhizobiales bacterium GAS113]